MKKSINKRGDVGGKFSAAIQEVFDTQVELVKCQKQIHKLVKKLGKDITAYIQEEWNKTFPGVEVHFLTGFEGGCMTDQWNASIFFYSVGGMDHHKGAFYEVYADDLPRGKVRKVASPISVKKLKDFVKRMSDETGTNCKLCNCTYVNGCLRGDYDNDDWGDEVDE